MNIPIKNLVVRRENYYFRTRLPRLIHRKSTLPMEIKVTLQTKDLKKAIIACKLMTNKFDHIVRTKEIYQMTLNEIRTILADKMSEQLENHARQLADYGRICPDTKQEGMQIALNMMDYFETDRDNGNPIGRENAQGFLKDIPHTESDLNFMAQEWTLAQIFLARMQHDRIAGTRFATEYNKAIYDEIMTGNYRSAQEIREAETVHPLNLLMESYIEEKASSWGASMAKKVTACFDMFNEYFSADEDIKTIRHQNLLDYRNNILLKLPLNRNTNPKFKNVPIRELASQEHEKTLSVKTVNEKMAIINGFFLWALRHDYIDKNPAENLQLSLSQKASQERLVFTTEDLITIFTNLRPDKLNNWKSYKLWIPLIALYSGARMGEICQLRTENIFTVNDIPCMEITDKTDEYGSVKNINSIRTIPIHPILVQLGFLEYVLRKSKNKDTKLWNLKYKEGYGYTHDYSKSFGRFKNNILENSDKKTFHSFRHTFTNALKQQGIQESMIAELVGHTIHSETFGRYGKEYNPEIMLENLCKLDYESNIFEILGVNPIKLEKIKQQIEQLSSKK